MARRDDLDEKGAGAAHRDEGGDAGWESAEALAESYLERVRAGERPDISSIAKKHPALADWIRGTFPAMLAMEQMADSDAPSFPDPVGRPVEPELPKRIGDYRILREIGRGGMGVVYEAIEESLARRVALKILPGSHLGDEAHRERFLREARAAARLHHAGIVPVFGFGEANGVHYYAMQFIRGQGLDRVIDELRAIRARGDASRGGGGTPRAASVAQRLQSGTLRLERPADDLFFRSVARIGAQVASALDYAHAEGVLHRDIKPSNLLVDAGGGVWVTDFGLATAEGSDPLTRSGDVLGTVPYMAPERFRGWSDPRSDLYGLGLTLYELLTLRRAFDHADQASLLRKILEESPVPPRRIDPRVPRDLETIVLKAIAREPGERYGSAGALRSDLELFAAGKPIRARRSGAWRRCRLWCRRNPALASLGAVAVVLSLVVVLVSLRSAHEARSRASHLQRQLYASTVRLSQSALEEGDVLVGLRLLAEAPARHRGWEWDWLQRLAASSPKTLRGHDGYVYALSLSPDGARLVSGGNDRSLILWNARTGERLVSRPGHGGRYGVMAVVHHPDGERLVSAGADRWIRIRDAATLAEIEVLRGHEHFVNALALSGDGTRLVSTSFDHVVKIWDLDTREELRSFTAHDDLVYGLAVSPDGSRLLTSGEDRTIKLWDSATGECLYAAEDRTVRVWNLAGKPVRSLHGHADAVLAVTFSPDGRRLLSGGKDSALILWDASTGEAIRTLSGHSGWIWSVAFSPRGDRIVSGGSDGAVKLWDPRLGQELLTLRQGGHWIVHVEFSPEGRDLLSCPSWMTRINRLGARPFEKHLESRLAPTIWRAR